MSYNEPQWTTNTKLMSQIIQTFNFEGNKDLALAYCQPEIVSIVDVLLEAVNRRTPEMGQEWASEARKLVQSDLLFPVLRETMAVLEDVTDDVIQDEEFFNGNSPSDNEEEQQKDLKIKRENEKCTPKNKEEVVQIVL